MVKIIWITEELVLPCSRERGKNRHLAKEGPLHENGVCGGAGTEREADNWTTERSLRLISSMDENGTDIYSTLRSTEQI